MNYFLQITSGAIYPDYLIQSALWLAVVVVCELERARLRIERYQAVLRLRSERQPA